MSRSYPFGESDYVDPWLSTPDQISQWAAEARHTPTEVAVPSSNDSIEAFLPPAASPRRLWLWLVLPLLVASPLVVAAMRRDDNGDARGRVASSVERTRGGQRATGSATGSVVESVADSVRTGNDDLRDDSSQPPTLDMELLRERLGDPAILPETSSSTFYLVTFITIVVILLLVIFIWQMVVRLVRSTTFWGVVFLAAALVAWLAWRNGHLNKDSVRPLFSTEQNRAAPADGRISHAPNR